MRAVIQRVGEASVTVDGKIVSQIGCGYLVLLGVARGDGHAEAEWIARKIAGMRLFEDAEERMNLSLDDIGGGLIVVSQFTLCADCRKGNRPSFIDAAPAEDARALYEEVVTLLRARFGEERVGTGVFQTHMDVRLHNDGPVTIVLDTANAAPVKG
ncbi:MAG: D-tyrosyl-tRNA(Tyr) deacylase [Kiritimatiellae bacterium]|nr:D-tyrosyl-tRNA(Tyr) deacylase [Kiritimatiellia bacterium]